MQNAECELNAECIQFALRRVILSVAELFSSRFQTLLCTV